MVVVTVMVEGPSDLEGLGEEEGSEVGLGADSDPDSEPVAAGTLELGPPEALLEAPGISPEADLEAPGTSLEAGPLVSGVSEADFAVDSAAGLEADFDAPGASLAAGALVSGAAEADLGVDSEAGLEADSMADLDAVSEALAGTLVSGTAEADLEADSAPGVMTDSAPDLVADPAADVGAGSSADLGADSAADVVTPSKALPLLSPALLVSAAALVTLVLSLPDHSLAPQTFVFLFGAPKPYLR